MIFTSSDRSNYDKNGLAENSTVEANVRPNADKILTTEWTARRIVMATLTALVVAFAFLLLYRFYMIVFIFFVAFTLQIALRPAVAWL